ncbi:MAG: C1A family cysteine protease [Desulforhopalus sp.]|jgi:C1A family cysteine protease
MSEVNANAKLGMGWLPDYPDFRDHTVEHKEVSTRLKSLGQKSVKAMLTKVGVAKPAKVKLPASVDLRAWCSPIENQGSIGSCTANAGVGIVEYFERRAFGKHIDASRLFLYKTTRNMSHWTRRHWGFTSDNNGGTGAVWSTARRVLAICNC